MSLAVKNKRLIKFIFRLAVTIFLLSYILCRIDLHRLAGSIKTARLEYVIVTWLLTAAAFWIGSVKFRLILRQLHCHVDTAKVFAASAVTALYGMFLPGMLDIGVKWYILKQHTGSGGNVFSGMAYNQFTVILVMFLMGLAAVFITNPGDGLQLSVCCVLLFIITSAAILLFL